MTETINTRPAAQVYDEALSAAVTRFAAAMRGVDADRERLDSTYSRQNYAIPAAEEDAHADMLLGACDQYDAEAGAAWEQYRELAGDEPHGGYDTRDFPPDAARLIELPPDSAFNSGSPLAVTRGPDGGWKIGTAR